MSGICTCQSLFVPAPRFLYLPAFYICFPTDTASSSDTGSAFSSGACELSEMLEMSGSTHLLHPLHVLRALLLSVSRSSVSHSDTQPASSRAGTERRSGHTVHPTSCTPPCAYQQSKIFRQSLLCKDELLEEVRSAAEVDKQQPPLIANLSDSHLWDITGAALNCAG